MSIPSGALAQLLAQRWVLIPRALDSATAAALAECAPDQWEQRESPAGARLSYSSMASAVALVDAPQEARDCAAGILDGLAAGKIDVPPFNKASWNKYEPGKGHIDMHRDGPAVGGVIAVITLYGEAVFAVQNHGEFPVKTGDLVLMSGNGWPAPDDECVRHSAGPPIAERMILTLRHNVNGPAGSWWSRPDQSRVRPARA